MKSVLLVFLATGLVFIRTGRLESRGQEKKNATPNALKLQILLEEINVKGQHVFLTGTFRITQPVGGETVSSKLVDIPVTADAKIKIGDKEGKVGDLKADMSVTLQLVEDKGGLVVVGILTIKKADEKKP
jgi:hypothetical protein